MTLREKIHRLYEIYKGFEAETAEFRRNALCRPGCSFCCTEVGNVDIVTLEGWVIRDRLETFPGPAKAAIRKKIEKNRRLKRRQSITRCPLLKADNNCLIYDVRPFSCRWLYSIRECRGNGPTVHRMANDMARRAVVAIRRVDPTGCSGHLTFVLQLLDRSDFRIPYEAGESNPATGIDLSSMGAIEPNHPKPEWNNGMAE